MAERDQPSKSKRVQEFLRANPQARNRDVVSELKEFGVTAADVSNAKAQLKKRSSRNRSRAAAAVAATVSTEGPILDNTNSTVSMAEIEAAIVFVQDVGGLLRAQQLLRIIQQVQQMS